MVERITLLKVMLLNNLNVFLEIENKRKLLDILHRFDVQFLQSIPAHVNI